MFSHIELDEAQQEAVLLFNKLTDKLTLKYKKQQTFFYKIAKKIGIIKPKPSTGIYLWGGVGRGKTYLMDVFYHHLPIQEKKRFHFHRFMQHIHQELQHVKGQENPLDLIAKKIAKQTLLLCFDEFFVDEITDAMILARLLEALFKQGVTLVATSNSVPDELYKNGFQRQKFLPAIALIKKHTQVFHLDNPIDYRLRLLEQAEVYHYPSDQLAHKMLEKNFLMLSGAEVVQKKQMLIEERPFLAMAEDNGVLWCDFKVICKEARSQNDYIELAKLYHTVLISDVYQLTENHNEEARRFINLIDIFYERNVKLIISAQSSVLDLYQGKKLAFAFQRTTSRLIEMQSTSYLARGHNIFSPLEKRA